MQLELNPFTVEMSHFFQPWKIEERADAPGLKGSLLEAAMAFPTAPMILAEQRQKRVAECQFRLGNVPLHKVGVLAGKVAFLQPLFGEEQSRAAIHQKARGFG